MAEDGADLVAAVVRVLDERGGVDVDTAGNVCPNSVIAVLVKKCLPRQETAVLARLGEIDAR